MKIYQMRVKKGKLKYSDEHIHFTLDGTDEYNWRLILEEINNFDNLSLPENLLFETVKTKIKTIGDLKWLKTDFMLPIWKNDFIEFVAEKIEQNFEKFPITIQDKRKVENKNNDFSAFYLKEPFECINFEKTELEEFNGKKSLNLKKAVFNNNLDYPLLFKIKGTSMSNTHYCTSEGKKVFELFDTTAFEFIEVN